ncbi:GNAT family N-acetyltransferase [bacterium]|jgi:RimJ/RimL family protein N-acetyltransferase|nr:GNAT family N-acetyltransferase [bacterium]
MKDNVIFSENIYFREISIDDIDGGWLEWINDKTSKKFLSTRKKQTKENLIQYLEESIPPLVYMFAVCLVENDKYIGNARLSSVDRINNKCTYGRLIGDKNLRGQGIGTEILKLLAYYAFYNLNLNRIETGVVKKNIASIRSNEKAGFIFEGVLRESELINDTYEDVIRFSMLRSDFEKKYLQEKACKN